MIYKIKLNANESLNKRRELLLMETKAQCEKRCGLIVQSGPRWCEGTSSCDLDENCQSSMVDVKNAFLQSGFAQRQRSRFKTSTRVERSFEGVAAFQDSMLWLA